MSTELEEQLPRFAESFDRDAPAISVDEILSRGTVDVDLLGWPSWGQVQGVAATSWGDVTTSHSKNGERDASIEFVLTAAEPPAHRRLGLKVAMAAAAAAVSVVALSSIVRIRDEPGPADVPPPTLPAPPPTTHVDQEVSDDESIARIRDEPGPADVPPSTLPAAPPTTQVDREVSDEESIAPTSGGMWPQSTLDEVSAAQERADAGDANYTWQVDPTLIDETVWVEEPEELKWVVEEPGKLVDRFIREGLGWEAYMREPSAGTDRNGVYKSLTDQRYLRCAPGRSNPLYPPSPEPERSYSPAALGELCAPTIDDLNYESVSLDLTQPVRRGADGVWVVSRWRPMEPFSQRDPAVVEVQAREPVEEFLAARLAGTGAEGLMELGQQGIEVPLLYATTAGAPYERYEIERVNEEWPGSGITFSVRLFADNDATVVEQEFLWSIFGLRMDHPATTENGQPVVLSHTSSDGEVTVSAASTWTMWLPGKDAGKGGHEQALDVWFGGLWRSEELSFSGERIELVDPVAYDAWCAASGGSPLLSAPADAAAIAQQVIADPNFETTAPVTARVGGLEAVSIDVALAPGGKACGIGMIEISRWIHTLGWEPGWRLRLYVVDLPEGMSVQTLAITVVAPEDRFDDVIAETAPIIESIQFHPPAP